ncbi:MULTISPECIES: hypothetical protein [unclassified Serratia (in: enterobacteria)]|uniref:hypothetical protein n=1 Tax=unclassified Serratia (in: enterobacteria) TaxID=2647522 RepID=UPI000503B788|nr:MULTISPECIES: hypothetical protein [unclassified Serratia (in: enterobacteria)]KFK97689.1 membrane protein [Serratia sp. Ag2]KFK97956.1 membrane protein [Serratia sp. Ag1]
MANANDEVTDVQAALLERTLASWRFLLLMAAPPLLWVMFAASPSVLRVVIALLSGVSGYGCWRLWLDAGYLARFNAAQNQQAGAALALIWQRERLTQLSLAERQQGALQQLRRTILVTLLLWGCWLLGLALY